MLAVTFCALKRLVHWRIWAVNIYDDQLFSIVSIDFTRSPIEINVGAILQLLSAYRVIRPCSLRSSGHEKIVLKSEIYSDKNRQKPSSSPSERVQDSGLTGSHHRQIGSHQHGSLAAISTLCGPWFKYACASAAAAALPIPANAGQGTTSKQPS